MFRESPPRRKAPLFPRQFLTLLPSRPGSTLRQAADAESCLPQACKAKTLDAVVVATDDERIAEVCRAAGARVVMTHPDCPNGAGCRRLPASCQLSAPPFANLCTALDTLGRQGLRATAQHLWLPALWRRTLQQPARHSTA
jgi:hypothetical protein